MESFPLIPLGSELDQGYGQLLFFHKYNSALKPALFSEQYRIKFEFLILKVVLNHQIVENKSNCISKSFLWKEILSLSIIY